MFGLGNRFNQLKTGVSQLKTGFGKAKTFLHSVKNRNPFRSEINNIQTGEVNNDNFKEEFAKLKETIERNYKGYGIDCLLKNKVVKFNYQNRNFSYFSAGGESYTSRFWNDAYRLQTLYNDDKTWKYDNIQNYSSLNDLSNKLFISNKMIIKVTIDKSKLHLCKPTSKGGSSNATYRRHERSRSSSRKNYKRTSVNRARSVNHTRKYLNRK